MFLSIRGLLIMLIFFILLTRGLLFLSIRGLLIMLIFFMLLTGGLVFELGKKALTIYSKQNILNWISKKTTLIKN